MIRRLLLGAFFIGVLWTAGLVLFINRLPRPDAAAAGESDGVIAYTGGGGARIATAMALFAGGTGQRLLISGVHPDISKDRLHSLWKGAPEKFECCVDIGHEARTTEGNAAEVSAWAAAHNYKRIILVTSEYHMPRAVIVTRAQTPDVTITPFAVASGYFNENGRPASFEAWRKLSGEYTKYLLARIKVAFMSFGR